jgi:hypothetical protein
MYFTSSLLVVPARGVGASCTSVEAGDDFSTCADSFFAKMIS